MLPVTPLRLGSGASPSVQGGGRPVAQHGPFGVSLCRVVCLCFCRVQRFCRLALCFHKLEGRFLAYPVFREVRTELLKKPQTHQDHFEAEASQTAALLRLRHPSSAASSPLPPIGMGLGGPTAEQLSHQLITQDTPRWLPFAGPPGRQRGGRRSLELDALHLGARSCCALNGFKACPAAACEAKGFFPNQCD